MPSKFTGTWDPDCSNRPTNMEGNKTPKIEPKSLAERQERLTWVSCSADMKQQGLSANLMARAEQAKGIRAICQ